MTDSQDETTLGFLNLHDAFMNASLALKSMQAAPVEGDLLRFNFSDRARFERLWVALLAVLIEAWDANESKPIRQRIAAVTTIDSLVALLRDAKKSGRYDKILACRNYVAHRGKREYWDNGRLAPIGELRSNLELHHAFSAVLLDAASKLLTQKAARP